MGKKKTEQLGPGPLFAIGGAEDRYEEKFILTRFFEHCGGKRSRIAILPTASADALTGSDYQAIFEGLGSSTVDVLPIYRRKDADDPEIAGILESATGIFLTGGDQNKILTVLEGSEALAAIHRAHARGAVVGGTSAGAAALSDPMIGGGGKGSLARSGLAKITSGLGLTTTYVVDQHFHQRERLGRLMYSVMVHPTLLGLGVDEDTAAIIHANGDVDAIGRGTVTIVNGSGVKTYNPAVVPDKAPMAFSNLVLHTLTHGCRFSAKTKMLDFERRKTGG